MSKVTIFIDESGTLPDPKDKVVIVAAVGAKVPDQLMIVEKQTRKALQSQKKKQVTSEIKFYRSGEKTKLKYLKKLADLPVEIFVLVVDKKGQKVSDTPLNFAVLCYILIEECLQLYEGRVKEVIFDRHFHRQVDEQEFNGILISLIKKELIIKHVDSIGDARVNSADMVAGSALWAHTGKSKKFYQILSGRIISEKILNWKEAKWKFYQKIKTSPNRRKRPSK